MTGFNIEDDTFFPAHEAWLKFNDLDKSKYAQQDFIRYLSKREKLNIEYAEKRKQIKWKYGID